MSLNVRVLQDYHVMSDEYMTSIIVKSFWDLMVV